MPSLAAPFHDSNQPLLDALRRVAGPALSIENMTASETSWSLADAQTDLALISPLFFGKRESDVALLGGACVAAVGATGEWLLHFHRGMRSIETVGYFGERDMSVIVAEILLKEKYGMQPRMQQLPVQTDPAYAQALFDTLDAVVTTSEARRAGITSPSHIDLIDEWFDMTQLPLVREVFIGWETRLDAALDATVRAAGEATDTDALRRVDESLQGRAAETEHESLPAHFRYRFTEDVLEGLQTFFHLAFYYGLHRDIPDLIFWSEKDEEDVRA